MHAAIFESLYTTQQRQSVAMISRRFPGLDAEDIVAEGFARLWAARERYDWTNPAALLTTTVVRIAIDTIRARRPAESLYDDDAENGLRVEPAMPEATTNAEGRLAEALASLTPDQRAVLVARAEGLTFGEIAARLGISEDACKKLARRARARLERESGRAIA